MRKTYHMFSRRGNIAVSRLVDGAKESIAGMLKFNGPDGMRFALLEGIRRISKKHPEVEASIVRESIAFEFIDAIPYGIRYPIWLQKSEKAKQDMLRAKKDYQLGQKFPGILG